MPYSPNNLSREEMLDWAKERFPDVKIRTRLSTNGKAEARHKTTGELLAAETSMFKLKKAMETKNFKAKLERARSGFGFNTATFKGKGY
jgi:hypothetical protein